MPRKKKSETVEKTEITVLTGDTLPLSSNNPTAVDVKQAPQKNTQKTNTRNKKTSVAKRNIQPIIPDMGSSKLSNLEQKSQNPMVRILGESVSEEEGIKIELDWNPAFIKYLRKNGLTATNDEQLIQKWIAMLYRDLIENAFPQKTSDYE